MGLVLDLPNIVGNETDPPAWGELGRSGFNLFGSQCPYSRMGRTLYFNRRAFGLSASLLPHGANCYPSDVFQQVGSVSTPAWGEPRGSLFTYDRLQRLYSRMGRTTGLPTSYTPKFTLIRILFVPCGNRFLGNEGQCQRVTRLKRVHYPPKAIWQMLMAAFKSAFSSKPHFWHLNSDCDGLFALSA